MTCIEVTQSSIEVEPTKSDASHIDVIEGPLQSSWVTLLRAVNPD